MSQLNVSNETPDYMSMEYAQMVAGWQLIEDLRKGQPHMRSLGKRYLPQNPLETKKKYDNRVAMTRFYNVYKHTEESLLGLAFRKDPKLGADVPKAIKGDGRKRGSGITENIDLQGTHIALFLRQAMKYAFDGHSFIHVDMPPKLAGKVSRADEVKAGRRPYWRHYRANQAFNWDIQPGANGIPRLAQISFLESVQVRDGRFGKKFIKRFRVLVPGGWELWEETVGDSKTTLSKKSDGVVDLDEIPVAVIYGHKTGALTSQPVLEDLAWENVYHFQLCSDFRNSAHVALTPVMKRVNARVGEDKKPIPLGVDKIIDVGLGGDVGWVELKGSALPHARTEIKDSEGRMAVIGVSLVGGRPDIEKTATQSILDNVEQTSSLGLIVRSTGDAAEQCLGWSSQFMDAGKDGGSLQMNSSFTNLQLEPSKIDALSSLVEKEQLTIETMWAILQRAEELPDEFDAVIEAGRLSRLRTLSGAAPNQKGKDGQEEDTDEEGKGTKKDVTDDESEDAS
jgi:hypothetical protein